MIRKVLARTIDVSCWVFVILLWSLIFAVVFPANAHDKWANGAPIPEWVKSHCCNGDEAHDLTRESGVTAEDIKIIKPADGSEGTLYYQVIGFNNAVGGAHVFPSQDGHIWAFISPAGPPNGYIWCLFMPCVTNEDMPKELNASCS